MRGKMRGKIIEIEGTDCSGKRTQSEMLNNKLNKNNIKCSLFSFPDYDTPTGKIVGGSFLGKTDISPTGSWFKEGAVNVPKKIAATYYILDRAYAMPAINAALQEGQVVADRWADSNLAYNGSNFEKKKDRLKMYKWLENTEYKVFGNPEADIKVFLYVPFEISKKMKMEREQKSTDEYEWNKAILRRAEQAYFEIAKRGKYKIINCTENGKILSREQIHEKVYSYVISKLTIR